MTIWDAVYLVMFFGAVGLLSWALAGRLGEDARGLLSIV